jgi:energy-coupling factor transporter ATP-binding protein EcfA2
LIVDEVLAVGDAAFQKKCFDKLRQTTSTGQTVLLVSHQLNSVRELCSQALWLERGRVRGAGDPTYLIPRYMTEAKNALDAGDWLDLTNLPRSGNGNVRFTAARYHGTETTHPPVTGGPLTVVAKLTSHTVCRDAVVGLHIRDRFGSMLIDAATYQIGQPLTFAPGQASVSLTIEALHLNAGSYIVDLWAGSLAEQFDSVSEAFEIEVSQQQQPQGELKANLGLIPRRFHFAMQPVS